MKDITSSQTNILIIFLLNFRYVLREHVHPDGLKSQLSIPSVLRSDSGLFSCEASNDYGREEKSIQLIVQGGNF